MSNPWNLANMTEEKSLKKTFIIATLCSTLIGTFSSSIGLWDRVNEKRRQKRKDTKQDDEIRKLRDQVNKAGKQNKEREEDLSRQPREDDLCRSLERSGALIMREYDEGLERLGRRYAVGDIITENQLQAQILALQQTVISVLQDALLNNRTITRHDMQRLILASKTAREGSLDALRQQYQRLLLDTMPPQRRLPPPKRASMDRGNESIFCRYSLDLQHIPRKQLSASFAPGGNGRCPYCRVRLDIASSNTYWHIEKRVPAVISDGLYKEEIMEDHSFHLGQRFAIKCHTENGDFACVLCHNYRSVHVICSNLETLVNHVGKAHDAFELAKDMDLRERLFAQRAFPDPGEPNIRDRQLTQHTKS
ncbi:hypothetical protein F5X96DRAFT_649458 [Biscogniauxia mediterranea]|nr:hypothetical protein F5X96DRAFT_649458 [Biscogniauxia mediterranea]